MPLPCSPGCKMNRALTSPRDSSVKLPDNHHTYPPPAAPSGTAEGALPYRVCGCVCRPACSGKAPALGEWRLRTPGTGGRRGTHTDLAFAVSKVVLMMHLRCSLEITMSILRLQDGEEPATKPTPHRGKLMRQWPKAVQSCAITRLGNIS